MYRQPCVYVLSSPNNNVLYIGVTSQLKQRIWQHKNNIMPSFTSKYNVHNLVYYELFEEIEAAIAREKQLKTWKRAWKNELVKSVNPSWQDLYHTL